MTFLMQSIILSHGDASMCFFKKKKSDRQVETELIRESNLDRLEKAAKSIDNSTKKIEKATEEKRDVTRMLFEATRGGKK